MQLNTLLVSGLALVLFAATARAQGAQGAQSAQGKVHFQSQVLPILERSCADCHRAEYKDSRGRIRKPKVDLRLDGKGWILKGSKNGVVVVPGKPEDSPLYRLTTLDPDDDDIMPAKGKPLNTKETDLIKRWISEGCDFGSWTGADGPGAEVVKQAQDDARPATLTTSRLAVWDALGKGLQAPLPQAVAQAAGRKCQVVPVMPGSPLLCVAYVSNESVVTDRELEKLAPLAGHITQLGLGRTKITDAALGPIGRMKLLTRLDLNRTHITDDGLQQLSGLTELRYLNLHGTGVTNRGIQALGQLGRLESVYLWNTKVDAEGVRMLRELLPRAKIHFQLAVGQVDQKPKSGASSRRRRRNK